MMEARSVDTSRAIAILWLIPIAILYAIGLIVPLFLTLERALSLGLTGWRALLSNPLFVNASLNTIVDSAEITIIATALAYSIAFAIWRSNNVGRVILITTVVVAFVTTVLVKIVAFNALLRVNGIVNRALIDLGLISAPLRMYPGRPAMLMSMVQYVLPFAVFPILGVMMRIDSRLERAAESLGASSRRVFLHILLPLSLPGVVAGALLVFVICTGFYVIPAALGTPRDQLLANVVTIYALNLVDFRVASGVATVLVAAVMLLTVLYQRADRAAR